MCARMRWAKRIKRTAWRTVKTVLSLIVECHSLNDPLCGLYVHWKRLPRTGSFSLVVLLIVLLVSLSSPLLPYSRSDMFLHAGVLHHRAESLSDQQDAWPFAL